MRLGNLSKSNNKARRRFTNIRKKTQSVFSVSFLILVILFTGCIQSENSVAGSTSTPVPQPSPKPAITHTPVPMITSTPSSPFPW